jgi:hypothetical protein
MTRIKLTPAEMRLLDLQRSQGIPYPAGIFAWQKAHAAELAALDAELSEAEAQADACR